MRRGKLAVAHAVLAASIAFGIDIDLAAANAAPIEAYGAYPTLEQVVISPNGERLAYATGNEAARVVIVLSLADLKVLTTIKIGTNKLRGIAWADNDRVLVSISRTDFGENIAGPKQEWLQSTSYSVVANEVIPLLAESQDSLNVIVQLPVVRNVDGHTVVYVIGYHFVATRGSPQFYKVDLTRGRTDLDYALTGDVSDWAIDGAGNFIAEAHYSEKTHHWSLLIKRDSEWQEVLSADTTIEQPVIEGLSEDGQAVLVRMTAAQNLELKAISLKDGTISTVSGPAGKVRDFIADPFSGHLIGGKTTELGSDYFFFSQANQSAWRSIANAFQSSQVELISASRNLRKVVVRVTGHDDGAAYELVDLNTAAAKPIGPVYSRIGPDDVATAKPISYKAADGLQIPAYLTLPNGRPAKNLALIVLPHGGPASRDEPGFDWWAQALASRGYAVLQPEFRGSSGFGWDHLAAGFGEWGRKMQTDLSDGVRHLVEQGIVDPKRVCIVGASYGGYAALAGVTLDKETYRCAVSVAGISDPGRFISWRQRRSGKSNGVETRYWERFMGASDPQDQILGTISPLAHVDQVNAPILLVHGKDDTVVPIEQSELMADALKKAGKDVSFVTLDGEDHWLSVAETRTQMLTAMAAFLEKNNPP